MTIGTGYEAQADMALLQSAMEDRLVAQQSSGTIEPSAALELTTGFDPSDGVNHSGGSSFVPGMPLMPSSAGLTGTIGAQAVTQGIRDWHQYEASLGTSWPTPNPTPYYEITPTVEERQGDIFVGWNAASQPGSPPGMGGFAEINAGAMSYEEAMNYSPAPLTDNLGNLRTNFREPRAELRPGFAQSPAGAALPFLALVGTGLWLLFRATAAEE